MEQYTIYDVIRLLENQPDIPWQSLENGLSAPVYPDTLRQLPTLLQEQGLWDNESMRNMGAHQLWNKPLAELSPLETITVVSHLIQQEPFWPGLLDSSVKNGILLKLLKRLQTSLESWESQPMNILVTLDRNYLTPLIVMVRSLVRHNPGSRFHLYVLHSSLTEEDFEQIRQAVPRRCSVISVEVDGADLADAPVTDRYPKEMYYRIFAAKYLPLELDRVLYLDPDMIVNGSLRPLYSADLTGYYFAAASHVKGAMQKFNEFRLDMDETGPYINSGVMLMNLELLRQHQDYTKVYEYINQHKTILFLPDQDVISGLYASKILALDPYRFNMTERLFTLHPSSEAWMDLNWVRQNSVIIHYCGRNKPWRDNYLGMLNTFYLEEVAHNGKTIW